MILTKFQFRQRFTFPERVAITEAARANTQVQTLLDDMFSAQEVDTDLPETVTGLGLLESVGLLAPGRAAEVLAAPAPDMRPKRYDISTVAGDLAAWCRAAVIPSGTDFAIDGDIVTTTGTLPLKEI